MITSASGTLAAAGEVVGPLLVHPHTDTDVAVKGTFVATITIEGTQNGQDWFPIATITGPGVWSAEMKRPWLIRATILPGEYTSGTADVVIA